ncbi:MAG: hypothetical protein GF329_19910 [Candidatus Lokiarchaeota archaeon]|nr:hypothetical protein [Candidatus Lokiarchaeota archaeon]
MWNLEDFKLGVGTSNAQINEEINRRYFLCNEKVDRYKARTQMEIYRLKKMKGDSVESKKEGQINLEVLYKPYFIISGKHNIIHLRKGSDTISLREDVLAINIGDSIFNINDLPRTKNDLYQLNYAELVGKKNENQLIFDSEGREIKENDIPKYKKIEDQLLDKIINEKQIDQTSINEKKLIVNFKKSLMKPSEENIRTIEEKITINLDIILRARYKGTITIYDKNKEMIIDSVSGKSKLK